MEETVSHSECGGCFVTDVTRREEVTTLIQISNFWLIHLNAGNVCLLMFKCNHTTGTFSQEILDLRFLPPPQYNRGKLKLQDTYRINVGKVTKLSPPSLPPVSLPLNKVLQLPGVNVYNCVSVIRMILKNAKTQILHHYVVRKELYK